MQAESSLVNLSVGPDDDRTQHANTANRTDQGLDESASPQRDSAEQSANVPEANIASQMSRLAPDVDTFLVM